MKDPPGNSSDQPGHDQSNNGGRVETMKKQHLPSSVLLSPLSDFVQFSSPFLLLVGILALEGGALGRSAAPRGGANVFQNGIEAIEEVLEVAAHSPKHSLVFFKTEAEELLSETLSQLTERHSWERGGGETPESATQNCHRVVIHNNTPSPHAHNQRPTYRYLQYD